MTRGLRLAVLVCASLGGLALTSSALAAYTPKLVVSVSPPSVSAKTTTVTFQQTRDDDATFRATIYVPLGWQGTLSQAAGTQIGTVSAQIQANQISPDAILTVNGVIVADNPANYTAQSLQCTQSALHAAVWLLRLEATGQQLLVPAYVDPIASGPEAAFASAKIQICLPPPAQATFQAKALSAALTLTSGAIAPPATSGQSTWLAVLIPFASNAGPVNVAGAVQARAIVRLPGQATLAARPATVRGKAKTVTLSGAVTEGGTGVAGAKVTLSSGTKPGKLKKAKTATTSGSGRFSFKAAVGKIAYFQVSAAVPQRDLGTAGCGTAIPGLPPCVSATAGAFTVTSRTVAVRRRR
jgi:hypothetical protein